jgi:Na+-driven multidrug efflux pump
MLLLGYGIEVALVALVARLGAVPVAANRLIDNMMLISFTALTACGTGVTVLAGQRLGAGDTDGAVAYRAAGLRLSALLAGIPLVPVVVAPELMFGMFTPDPRVATAAASAALLAVIATVPLVFALNLGGVLRAAGDTRTVLAASLSGDAFLVPLAWVLALELGLGLRGLMLAWLAYSLVYLAVSWWRYHAGAWRTAVV